MIYLDNNATTKPAPEVLEAMRPFYDTLWGNPSSLHTFGKQLQQYIDQARGHIAALLNAQRPSEITFTSGGTEADNLGIRGICAARTDKKHIITTAVEHSAVLRTCQAMERDGYDVTYLGVDRHGQLSLDEFRAALRPDTAVAAIMWVNNETGVCFPIPQLAEICAEQGVPLHVDAVATVGRIPIDLQKIPISTLAFSGHKIHGPKGVGALYVRRGTICKSILYGGGQESGKRPGTENVPMMIALGAACRLLQGRIGEHATQLSTLRNQLEAALLAQIPDMIINGHDTTRAPHVSNVSIAKVDGEGMVFGLSDAGIYVSTASACRSGAMEPSHVLTAMKVPDHWLRGTLRLSLSRYTTADDITTAAATIARVVAERRALNP